MKKNLVLFSLLFSLGALAEAEVPAEPNFVMKGLTTLHAKCARIKAKFDAAEVAKADWEEVKTDCMSLPNIPAAAPDVAAHNVPNPDETAPAADLPKDEI